MRTAKPADAAAVWRSMEECGAMPSVRTVAAALNACGQFHRISKTAVARWRKSNWAPLKTGHFYEIGTAAAGVEAALPVLTRDIRTRARDSAFNARDRLCLDAQSNEALAQQLAREMAITSMLLLRKLGQKVEAVDLFQHVGVSTLLQALSSQIEVVDNVIGTSRGRADAKALEDDDAEVWKAFEKAANQN